MYVMLLILILFLMSSMVLPVITAILIYFESFFNRILVSSGRIALAGFLASGESVRSKSSNKAKFDFLSFFLIFARSLKTYFIFQLKLVTAFINSADHR